jgi:hypothetical protein
VKDSGSKTRRALRPWQAYLIGQALVVLGAASMEITGSYVPLALAGSAALMLTVPLLRQIRERARRDLPPRRRS